MNDELFDRREAIEAKARSQGRTLLQHAILQAIHLPAVISVILEFKRIDQIESVIKLMKDEL